jgi:hypothetical protein
LCLLALKLAIAILRHKSIREVIFPNFISSYFDSRLVVSSIFETSSSKMLKWALIFWQSSPKCEVDYLATFSGLIPVILQLVCFASFQSSGSRLREEAHFGDDW